MPDPAHARPAPRVIPPDTARAADAPKGTFLCCCDIHRILSELLMKLGMLLSDGEHFTRDSVFQLLGFRPCKRCIETITIREIKKNEVLLDFFRSCWWVFSTNTPNIVVARSVGTSSVYRLLPFAVRFEADANSMKGERREAE